jgi:hypothetical protein
MHGRVAGASRVKGARGGRPRHAAKQLPPSAPARHALFHAPVCLHVYVRVRVVGLPQMVHPVSAGGGLGALLLMPDGSGTMVAGSRDGSLSTFSAMVSYSLQLSCVPGFRLLQVGLWLGLWALHALARTGSPPLSDCRMPYGRWPQASSLSRPRRAACGASCGHLPRCREPSSRSASRPTSRRSLWERRRVACSGAALRYLKANRAFCSSQQGCVRQATEAPWRLVQCMASSASRRAQRPEALSNRRVPFHTSGWNG